MLQFHQHIITDLLDSSSSSPSNTNALVILSSGLGLHKLITSLLHLHSPSQGTLLILSSTPSQKALIIQSLNGGPKPVEVTFELSVTQRHNLYKSNGILFMTSRILIVDLLNNKVPIGMISGAYVLNGHNVSETSTEGFIVRVMRGYSWGGFVRVFSDNVGGMVSGFGKAERVMKCLGLRRLLLWPRFQVYVSQDLERDPPSVVDIRVGMSGLMKGIQKAVVEAMGECLKEMRKSNKVDVEDLSVENGLFKSFDEVLRRQLDPIWHTLGRKMKQLVADLKTLRKLLDYLVRYDAVTYLKYLDTLRVSEGIKSVWIFADSSNKIFEFAKKRVYQLVRSDGEKVGEESKKSWSKKRKAKNIADKEKQDASASSGLILQEVLEEAPKWKVLREVLEEIEEERQKQIFQTEEEHLVDNHEADETVVLVACKDERSCMQLEDCILKGPRQTMREEWEKYLLCKSELHGLQSRRKNKSKEPKGIGILNGAVPSMPRENADGGSINRLERDVLLAAASELSSIRKEDLVSEQLQDRKSKAKGASTKCPKTSKKPQRTESNLKSMNDSIASENEIQIEDLRNHETRVNAGDTAQSKPLPAVHFYALESHQYILDVLKPSVIVVYHPDMSFVREVEIYKAENPSKKVKVYFLFYEDSTEVQKFEASIRKENGAFESLIRQKSLMMIPVNQDGHGLGVEAAFNGPEALNLQNSITRKAGGKKETEKEMQVIVDTREFMSSLPNVLHQKGMRIIPVQLEVGDYVLSPLICVERKSISDLYQSFASGRLFNQVETMMRYYRIPVLLIEFSQDKSFSFQSASEVGDDVTHTNIISKLSLLILHFPRLRIIWSRSLHATAEIFASLKANQDEPDETKAMKVGVPTEEGLLENDARAEVYNTSAVEFLRRLPGVSDSNYRSLVDGCNSLAELALLPVERLTELMGGQVAARTLRDFLDAKYPILL